MRDIVPGSQTKKQTFHSKEASHLSTPALGTQVTMVEREVLVPKRKNNIRQRKRIHIGFFLVVFLSVALGGVGLWQWKVSVETYGEQGFEALEQAARAVRSKNVGLAQEKLQEAEGHFSRGSELLFGVEHLLPVLSKIPGMELIVSGIALMRAGDHLAVGAQELSAFLSRALIDFDTASKNPSLLGILDRGEKDLIQGNKEIQAALRFLEYVHPESLPEEKQRPFQRSEALLPVLAHALDLSVTHLDLLKELIGGNGPRLYLFLFQNNHELRPTGGFIGSYALLEMQSGEVRRFFVDGIFNPDGQLKENIVPPVPIQKISTGWSLHDSNWFPDFPASAEKARFFYEKTGGPTTDGVIALTPEVLERLLRIMGPVDLPEYGVTIDAQNFVPLIQEEVEVGYDKEENNPKKILGDLTGVILRRLIENPNPQLLIQLGDEFVRLLNERHILLFARDDRIQALIENSHWSGKILPTPYDYLSVIHTNINGFKTDGVIRDEVDHRVSIQADGSLIDTVTITRTHTGGNTPYEWWNRVNANYMRVYVPLGSKLLSASGMTREVNASPVDYTALNFRRDPDVEWEEGRIQVDPESGTRIGEEFGKTVFGNWVYVSPGEQVTVTYRYRLPFQLSLNSSHPVPFSILYQKQPGTSDWKLSTEVEYPSEKRVIWQSGENLIPYGRVLKQQTNLNYDVFVGLVLQ